MRHDWDRKPGITNLIEMMSLFTGRLPVEIEDEYRDGGYAVFNEAVTEAVIEGLRPIREGYEALADGEVEDVMEVGARRAMDLAEGFQKRVRRLVGLAR